MHPAPVRVTSVYQIDVACKGDRVLVGVSTCPRLTPTQAAVTSQQNATADSSDSDDDVPLGNKRKVVVRERERELGNKRVRTSETGATGRYRSSTEDSQSQLEHFLDTYPLETIKAYVAQQEKEGEGMTMIQ